MRTWPNKLGGIEKASVLHERWERVCVAANRGDMQEKKERATSEIGQKAKTKNYNENNGQQLSSVNFWTV